MTGAAIRRLSPVDLHAFMREVMQGRECYGLLFTPVPQGRVAYDERTIFNGPANINYQGFAWNTLNYSGNQVIKLAANPQRKVLIIENIGTVNIAVAYGVTAVVGATPAGTIGHIVLPNGYIYTDRDCPTNDVYIALNNSAVTVTQGVPGP